MRKMLLVPAHQFPFRDSNVEKALELDREMENILQRKDIPEYDKAQKYSQALHKYLTLRNEVISSGPSATTTASQTDTRPIGVKAVQTDIQPTEELQTDTRPAGSRPSPGVNAPGVTTGIDLSSISAAHRPKARQLLNYISRSKSLTWDPQQRLKVDGKVIKGTDITALVREAVESSPSRTKPSNIKLFIKALADADIPQDVIGKQTYRNYYKYHLNSASPRRTRGSGKENKAPIVGDWAGFDP